MMLKEGETAIIKEGMLMQVILKCQEGEGNAITIKDDEVER